MLRSQGWLTVFLLTVFLVTVFLVTVTATSLTAGESLIGDRPLVVEGATTYPSEQIAQELATDIEIAHAASRAAPLEKLKALLVDKATQGYLHAGFADVAIQAAEDERGLVLRVMEGPRFTAGAIKTVGTTAIDAAELHDVWVQGEPAQLSSVKQQQLQKRAKALFEKHGYYNTGFSVTRALNRGHRTADLVIDVAELGDSLRANALEIIGDDRLSRAMVLDFLELAEDTVLTKEVQTHIEEALTDSGRFLSVKLEGVGSGAARPAHPRITLTPYDKAPPLNEPLSREQTALVKFAAWVRSFEERGDELLFKGKMDTIDCEIVGSPRFGTLGWIRGLPFGKPIAKAAPPFDMAFVESDGEVGIYSFRRQRRLTARPVPARFVTKMELILSDDPPQRNGTSKITTGAGLKSYSKRDKRHCDFRLKQTAVGALALAYRDDADFSWEGDQLTITVDTLRFVIDSRTGRLVRQCQTNSDAIDLAPMRAEQDEFNRQLQAIQTAGHGLPNDADGDRPLSCVVEYATEELDFWDANGQWSEVTGAVRKLLALGALQRIDEWLATPPPAKDEDEFGIPGEIVVLESVHSLPQLARVAACAWGIEAGDQLAPRKSWLWTLWREAAFLSAKMPSRLDDPAEYLTTSKAGPIECWIVATLLDDLGRDADARACAKIGLNQLNIAAFHGEYEALLSDGSWSGDLLRHMALMLRELNNEEAAALAFAAMASGLGDESILQVAAAISHFSTNHSEEPLADVLPKALDLVWDGCLHQALEATLRGLAEKPMSRAELQEVIDKIDVSLPKQDGHERGGD